MFRRSLRFLQWYPKCHMKLFQNHPRSETHGLSSFSSCIGGRVWLSLKLQTSNWLPCLAGCVLKTLDIGRSAWTRLDTDVVMDVLWDPDASCCKASSRFSQTFPRLSLKATWKGRFSHLSAHLSVRPLGLGLKPLVWKRPCWAAVLSTGTSSQPEAGDCEQHRHEEPGHIHLLFPGPPDFWRWPWVSLIWDIMQRRNLTEMGQQCVLLTCTTVMFVLTFLLEITALLQQLLFFSSRWIGLTTIRKI